MLGLGDGGRIFLLSSPHEICSKAFKCLKFDYRKLSILFLPVSLYHLNRLPWWLSGKEPTCQCRRHGFDPWVGKIPWRRKWQPTPVFLPGESHGQRSLVDHNPWGHKRVRHNLVTKQQQQQQQKTIWILANQFLLTIYASYSKQSCAEQVSIRLKLDCTWAPCMMRITECPS